MNRSLLSSNMVGLTFLYGAIELSSTLQAATQPASEPTKMLLAAGMPLAHLHDVGKTDTVTIRATYGKDGTTLELPHSMAGTFVIKPESGYFDAKDFTRTIVELKNLSTMEVRYKVLLENPNATEK